jgi:hypothetical protein
MAYIQALPCHRNVVTFFFALQPRLMCSSWPSTAVQGAAASGLHFNRFKTLRLH